MGTFLKKYADIVVHKILPMICDCVKSNKIKTISVSSLCIVLASVLTGITVATNVVYINDGNDTRVLYTMKNDAEDILESQGISLSADDTLQLEGFQDKNIRTINILRAFEVPVTVDGVTQNISVSDATVADVLKIANVTLSDDDLINVGLNEKVHEDTEIEVNRVVYRTVTSASAIPFTVKKQNSLMVGKGNTKISIAGKEGVRTTVSKEKVVDGRVVESEILEEKVTSNPITQLLLVGLAPKNPLSTLTPPNSLTLDAKGVPVGYKRKVSGKAVAYSALGRRTKLKQGNVAVDYRKFPKGSKLWICTPDQKFVYGYSVVADTGTFAKNPNSSVLVDLFFNSYSDSVKWGAKKVDIYVLN